MKSNVWVAVDKNGLECLFNHKPLRSIDRNPSWGKYWTINDNLDFPHFVILPLGTVEKLLGRKLIWEDGAVELDGKIRE